MDIVQEIDGGQVTVNYIRTLNIDEPLARIKTDGTVRYYQTDALGSVIALTDENGVIRTQYNYDPFGATEVIGEPSDNPFQYAGRENDGTGLLYERNRYYSFELQRYISQDPIRLAGRDVNFYVRVGNSPINRTDPLGLFDWVNPIDYWGDFFGGISDFQDNYIKMVDANIIGADRYYHCMANCQASRRGLGGQDAAEAISEIRELFDEYIKGNPRAVCDEDRAANRWGRKENTGMSCATLCAPLIHPSWKVK